MQRTGQAHLASLRDGRSIYIDGELVPDVTEHRAFRNVTRSVANLFDFAREPSRSELMTFETESGERANRIWQLPKSYSDLVERRRALEAWTTIHGGFLARAPDHVASCVSGMRMGLPIFESYNPARAASLEAYYRYARDNDLYLTYVLLNPQVERSKNPSEQPDPSLTAGVVDRSGEGITIRGAKMLSSASVIANEVFVTSIQPMQHGDERYAVSFAIPIHTKGLKLLSRKSYEAQANAPFDNPLASRYDENDSVMFFDDVKVPWERIFVDGDVEMCNKQFHATPAHVFQSYQSMVRVKVKLQFLSAIAHRTTQTNGTTKFPQVREMLGQLASEAAMVDAFVDAMEVKGTQVGPYFVPDRHMVYSAQVLTQQMYPKVLNTLRELAGAGMIMLPSSVADFAHPEISALIEKTQQSRATNSQDKVKFYKLAWDAVGSEFGSRHHQYEMFHAGASYVNKGHSYRTYDWRKVDRILQSMLDSYDLHSTK